MSAATTTHERMTVRDLRWLQRHPHAPARYRPAETGEFPAAVPPDLSDDWVLWVLVRRGPGGSATRNLMWAPREAA